MYKTFYRFALCACAISGVMVLNSCEDVVKTDNLITVDYSTKGAEINPQMYGVFFEEINHASDGALYADDG